MIIGISGRARSGKDTVADIVVRRYGFSKLSLAAPIKEACRTIFGWTTDHTDGVLKDCIDPRWGISPRQTMQLLGTEFGQLLLCDKSPDFAALTGRNLWVNRLLDSARGRSVVVSDVRFPHESEAIQRSGGIIIRVRRPSADSAASTHASETSLDAIRPDFCIDNTGTIEDLESAVTVIMGQVVAGILEGEYGNFTPDGATEAELRKLDDLAP